MINDIIAAIGKSLNNEFGDDYPIYSESVQQDFNTSCFFIECVKYSRDKALLGLSGKKRFSVSAIFKVTFFAGENSLSQNRDIWETADRIFDAVENIDGYSGHDLEAVASDKVLVVTVCYDFQAVKETDKNYMERLRQNGGVR